MATRERAGLPRGLGWAAGFATGVLVGATVWWLTTDATLALILMVATGTPLAFAFERPLGGRPLTVRQRRRLLLLVLAGIAAGVAVWGYALLVA